MSDTTESASTDESPSVESRRVPPAGEKKPASTRRKSTAKVAKETKAAETQDALSGHDDGESTPAKDAAAEAAVARAEQKVDQWGYEIGRWASRLVARAREEAEDILAEAQHLRKNGRS